MWEEFQLGCDLLPDLVQQTYWGVCPKQGQY